MAKARQVVSDNASGEVDELRRQFNNLLVIIEGTSTFATLQTAITDGVDTVSGNEINGVKPTPTHPRRPKKNTTVTLDASSDF